MKLKLWPWQQNEKPIFTNELGYSFYIDKNSTKYAKSLKLKDIVVFILEKDFKPITRMIVDTITNKELFTSEKLEDIAARLDIMAMITNGKIK